MITPIDSRGIAGRTDRIALNPQEEGLQAEVPHCLPKQTFHSHFLFSRKQRQPEMSRQLACQAGALRIWLLPPPRPAPFLWSSGFSVNKTCCLSYRRGEERVAGDAGSLSPIWAEQLQFLPFLFSSFFSLEANTVPEAEISPHRIPHGRASMSHISGLLGPRRFVGSPHRHSTEPQALPLLLSPSSSPAAALRVSSVGSLGERVWHGCHCTVQTGNV